MTTYSKEELRKRFESFSPELKTALRIAAERNSWDNSTWPLQVKMVSIAIETGKLLESEVIMAYSNPVKE